MLFRQLFDSKSSTYTYLLADLDSREALLIDPVLDKTERDLQLLKELGLKLKYIFDTHIHADHISGTMQIKSQTEAITGISHRAGADYADLQLKEGECYDLGDAPVRIFETPGHTNSCLSFHLTDRVFTGDALLIRGCGRTDFQEGSSETLFYSVREKLFELPGDTLVFPAHDYKGMTCSSIEEERKWNPRLKRSNSLDDFKKIMEGLQLAEPKMIKLAVPRNLKGGQEVV